MRSRPMMITNGKPAYQIISQYYVLMERNISNNIFVGRFMSCAVGLETKGKRKSVLTERLSLFWGPRRSTLGYIKIMLFTRSNNTLQHVYVYHWRITVNRLNELKSYNY